MGPSLAFVTTLSWVAGNGSWPAGTALVGVTGSKAFRTEIRKCGRLMSVSRTGEGSFDASAYVPAKGGNGSIGPKTQIQMANHE